MINIIYKFIYNSLDSEALIMITRPFFNLDNRLYALFINNNIILGTINISPKDKPRNFLNFEIANNLFKFIPWDEYENRIKSMRKIYP
jgi:hypothetical protein